MQVAPVQDYVARVLATESSIVSIKYVKSNNPLRLDVMLKFSRTQDKREKASNDQ